MSEVGKLDSPNNPEVPALNYDEMKKLAERLTDQWVRYKGDRRSKEEQWLRNARQFRGIYDPEIEKHILVDQSKAYPKVTRVKVIGTVSRLMEMLFPQTEKNWGMRAAVFPQLAAEQLNSVLAELQKLHEESGQEGDIPSEVIEEAVQHFSKERADEMEETIDDQLGHMDYVAMARRIVFSGVNYGCGILKGPQIRKDITRTWMKGLDGKYTSVERPQLFPFYEVTPIWQWYPDLSAKTPDQMDGSYERHIMSRANLSGLADRPDFFGNIIRDYLETHTSGNYVEEWWEQQLRREGDRKNPTDLAGRKYQLLEWWGATSGHELRSSGIKIPDTQLGEMFDACVWTIDHFTIKCVLTPYATKRRPHKLFIYEEDDINLLGTGLPEVMRDSQMAICEASRMLLDNASVVCGPILEVNTELLTPGQSPSIHAFKAFYREGAGQEAGIQAVREIRVESHIEELAKIIELFTNFANVETALPPSAMGDVTQGGSEALRTQSGVSMLMGAAALPIRDVVRNFDVFTEEVIGSLYDWNMQFNPDPDIKGDYVVMARGSSSLIAKEVRGQALDMFRASLSQDELDWINQEELLKERMKSRDIPDIILADANTVKQRQDARASAQNAQQSNIQATVSATVKELLSSAIKNMALARKADTSGQVDAAELLLKGIIDGIDSGTRARAVEHDMATEGNTGNSKRPKSSKS